MLTEQASEMVLPRFTWISWEPIILARIPGNGQSKFGYFPFHTSLFSHSPGEWSLRAANATAAASFAAAGLDDARSGGADEGENYFLPEMDFNCIR